MTGGRAPSPRSTARTLALFAGYGATTLGLIGGIVGLVIGLFAHPPTAWFAVLEVGLPGALVGGTLGLAGGALALGIRSVISDRR